MVVINTDDQRADTMLRSLFRIQEEEPIGTGPARTSMPKTMRWMADGGTNFVNGYVSIPSCCPSRATLMSGRYVHKNGQFGQQTLGFDLDLTLQRYLKDAGYFTGFAGKFLHWFPLARQAPYFDRWTYFKGGYVDVSMNFGGVVAKRRGYSTTITISRLINYLQDFEAR